MKVLLKRFHLKGHTIGFHPQTQKLEYIPHVTEIDSVWVKCSNSGKILSPAGFLVYSLTTMHAIGQIFKGEGLLAPFLEFLFIFLCEY